MIKGVVIQSIKFYQKFISLGLGSNCRFLPTCSEYLCQVIEKDGLAKGFWRGGKRILRCHPWGAGGIDLP